MVQYQQSLFGRPILPPEPPLIGYSLTADNPDSSKEFVTFMMARTLEDAFGLCIDYFPLEEGYVHLEVCGIVDARYNDIPPIKRRLMSDEYIEQDGVIAKAKHDIIPERQSELRIHIRDCDTCLQDCHSCWEYYSNQGHDEFVRALTE